MTTEVKTGPKRLYLTKYKPEYCDLLIQHMSEGLSFEAFSGLLRVNKTTIYNWLVLFPEFKEAKEVADGLSRLWAENQLKLQINGEVKTNPVALIFFLKNRFPSEWRDRRELDIKKDSDNCNNLTLDEQITKVEAMREHLLKLKSADQAAEPLTINTSTIGQTD